MSHQLDPLILAKLRAFAQRRRKLILIRGVCTALAMLLATMMVVAIIDRLFILSDGVRWALSLTAYAIVLIAEWRSCLRHLAHAPGPRRLARLVEHAEPKLREDLLSAVELGTQKGESVFDSVQFRELLQSDVAERMKGLDVDRLLPVNLVRRYLAIAGVLVVALIASFFATNFQFGTLLLRALLPGANLARVSTTKVEIVEPNPADTVVAHGDAVPLVIQLSEPAARAHLETFTKEGGREVVQLTALGPDRFAGKIQVGREDVRYRIRANDAITREYLLDAFARPHVEMFEKVYVPPAYTKQEPRTVTEEMGDLIALEGSKVQLRLKTNQPTKTAELRIDRVREQMATLQLPAGADGRLEAEVELNASGTYRVHLVSAETGFENKFTPEYEIRAEPDLVPQVELEKPAMDLILPANEMVDIIGTASDDVGLRKVVQAIRINEGPWKEVVIAQEPGLTAKIEHRWDLYEQGVKAGDLITTKLVAVDLKGSRSESRPLQITVTNAGFEMKRLQALETYRALREALTAWRASAERLSMVTEESRQRFDQTADNDIARGAAVMNYQMAYEEFARKYTDAVAALHVALRSAAGGHDSADLVLLGRMLSKIEAGTARTGQIMYDSLNGNTAAPFAKELARVAGDSSGRTVDRARRTEEWFRNLLAAAELDLLAENLQIIAREQERLAELAQNSGGDVKKWEQLMSRLRVVLSETKALEEMITPMADRAPSGLDSRFRNWVKEFQKRRERLETAIAEKGPGRDLLDPTLKLAKATEEAARGAFESKRGFARRPAEVITQMREELDPTWQNFDKLRQELEQLDANEKIADARGDLKTGHWNARIDLFKTHGDLEELRVTSDVLFVSDVRAVTLAMQGVRESSTREPWEQTTAKIGALDKAFRILEGGHDLQELHDGLNHLAVLERWDIASPKARSVPPRNWVWLEVRLRKSPDELGKLSLGEDTKAAIEGARKILWEAQKTPAWKTLDREMNERLRADRRASSVQKEAQTLAAEVKKAIDLLRPSMEAARQQIAQMAPKISEFAEQLAKETEAIKKETAQKEDAAEKSSPEENKREAEKQLASQERLNEKVETLMDLLRADANKQDVLQAEQRERARDSDDALAMLQEPPPAAERALENAVQDQETKSQAQDFAEAVEQQQKLETALNQIAKHFAALEQGQDPNETRAELRAAEQELGVKQALDEQYARAEQLAKMAQKSPQELLAQLEQQLPENPVMQQELSTVSQNLVNQAAEKLQQASHSEEQVANEVSQLAHQEQAAAREKQQQAAQNAADAAKQAAQAAEAAQKAADAAEQAAEQAGNQEAAKQADQASDQAEAAMKAAQEAAKAAEQMAQADQPQQAADAAKAAAQKASEAAKAAQQAADSAEQAQATAQKAAESGGDQQSNNEQSAQQAAEAAKSAEQAAENAMAAQKAAENAAQMAAESAMQDAQSGQMAKADGQQPQGNESQSQPGEKSQSPNGEQAQGQTPNASPSQPANPQLAKAAERQQPIAQMASEAGAEVARAGRHESRLANTQSGEQLQSLGAEIQETAMNEVPNAQKALSQAPAAAAAKASVNQASAELAAEAAALGKLAEGGAPSDPAQQPGEQPASQPAGSPESPAGQPAQQGQMAQNSQAGQPQNAQQASSPQQGANPSPGEPAGQQPSGGQQGENPASQTAQSPASPQEQVWMARMLDALDAALNSSQAGEMAQAAEGQPGQEGQGQPGQQPQDGQMQPGQNAEQQPGQAGQPSEEMQNAQSAMAAAAQAAQAAMRGQRSQAMAPTPGTLPASENMADKSLAGAQAQSTGLAYGKLPDSKGLKPGDWGKLPKKVAEQLSKGQQESVAAEYRGQVETYYRVIAERAKKQ